MEEKTNVMRMLDKRKVKYKSYTYPSDHALSGVEAAKAIGVSEEKVYKTLLTRGKSGSCYVFVIPCAKELELKKAAAAVGEKAVEMLKNAELLPISGYVHGGCSPIGMKKFFTTTIDSSAQNQETIVFSAGKIGYQVETSLEELRKIIAFELAPLTE